ncbi:hypothetical protein [Buttiauxella noackiae]|uniref:hypothetical protein n=1 Tax=Buttiauxella noackiae TaxID=82992 RepID=UPI0028D0ADD1|nr:hypothetical protein [Buttiauxella noackiae]
MAARLIKISHPVPANKNGQAFTDTEALLAVLNGESSGQYLVGRQGMWHGGIHITDTTIPWCALSTDSEAEQAYNHKGEQFIRCMADGEIVAYRVCRDYDSAAITWRDEKLQFSTSFVLVKHYIHPGENESSGLTFYTLYMNLAPFSAYATQGNASERTVAGAQRYYASADETRAGTVAGSLKENTRVTLSNNIITRDSDHRQFTEVTLAEGTTNAAGATLAAGTKVWTVSDRGALNAASSTPTPSWWSKCTPAYSVQPGGMTDAKARTNWSYYLSPDDVQQRKSAGHLAENFPVSYVPGDTATQVTRNDTNSQGNIPTSVTHTFSLVTLGKDVGKLKKGDRVWVVSDGDSLTPVTPVASDTQPAFGEVVKATPPVAISAGDGIGHMGFFQLPEDNGKLSRYQVHLECLSPGDKLVTFLTNPDNVDVNDKAAYLKYEKDAALFMKNGQGQIVASTRRTRNQGIATRSKVATLGADGQPVAAGAEPAYYQINVEFGWLAAASIRKVSQYALGELGFVTLDKTPESFDLIDGIKQPHNVVKGILEQMYQAASDETRSSHAMNEYNYKRLLEQIDANHDGHYSEGEYLQAVHHRSYRDHLYRIIAKHGSEWYYGKDDPLWDNYLKTLTTDAPEWKKYTEAFIDKITWMKEVPGMEEKPWHMHPLVFLDAIKVKNKGSLKGKLTYDAEGNNIPGSRFYSRVIHWPGNDESGVTLGRGYDMGNRSEESIYQDMIASGVDDSTARKISLARRYKGSEANSFVTNNRADIGEITEEQQVRLFDIIYPGYVTRTIANYNSWTTGVSAAKKWEQLDAVIQEVLVDFVYQGFTKGPNLMLAGANNDKQELINYIRNTSGISQYEPGRHRANYLERN